jgi:uncharacterized membrane protein
VVLLALAAPYFIWAGAHLEIREEATPGDMFSRFLHVLPLAVGVVALIVAAFARARSARLDAGTFCIMAAGLALYLLYGAELLFVHDLFGNRMNTVFKLYYQVWIVLAAIGAYGLHYWRSRHLRFTGVSLWTSRALATVVAVLLVGALYYSVAASVSKVDAPRGGPTLDGLAYLDSTSGAERAAIERLREVARPDDSIVEAVGGSFTEFGRISAATGIPAILGWTGHEHQWRGSEDPFEGREADVERIYRTDDAAEAGRLLARYGVTFVYVGARERGKYVPVKIEKFDELGTRFFEQGDVVIFRVKPVDDI